MLKFIHNYNPKYLEGLQKVGIFEKNDGFKVIQSFRVPEEFRFNNIAAKGGALYNTVKEIGGCLYVDRLQGGTFISHYDYDFELVNEYDNLTEDGFLGFQLHESGTTRELDWSRIKRQLEKTELSWNLENIIYAVTLVSHNKEFPHFSSGFSEEYAELTPPTTLSEYIDDLRGLWLNRQKKTGGRILNCDHSPLLCPLEREAGVKVSFIEVGAQSARESQQYALRRGFSRAEKKKWGVYIEPWGGQSEVTAYIFMRDMTNEWYGDPRKGLYRAPGGNGGSSMSLARRIMYYSLFAGTDYFSEEWGQANTFYEWDTFELSPYGIIKRDFLKNARRFGEIRPYVPIAFVLPSEYVLYKRRGPFPYPNDILAEEYLDIPQKIHAFLDDGRNIGFEDYVFESGGFCSIYDIIYDNNYDRPEEEYSLVIDFSGRLHGDRIIDGNDTEAVNAAVRALKDTFTFTLDDGGKLDYQIFESNGNTYLALYNHKGVSKTLEKGEYRHAEANVPYTLSLKDGRVPKAVIPSEGEWEISESAVHGVLYGGDMAVYEL